ncbi:MAG: hypothetical protein HKN28_10560 [Alphaproteobacteria bacterium]|nr:hypothetical protein [Alphaproteobacteria bacterium]
MLSQLQLLLFSALAFTLRVRNGLYPPNIRATLLDTDWFYRRLARSVMEQSYTVGSGTYGRFRALATRGSKDLSASSIATMVPRGFWRVPGRPAAWCSGSQFCSAAIYSSILSDPSKVRDGRGW